MALFLLVFGAVLELAGIALAVRDIHQRREDVKTYQDRPPSAFGTGSFGWRGPTLSGEGTLSAGPPSLEQRVQALEAALDRVAEEARKEAEGAALVRTEALRLHLAHDIEGVRRFALKVTEPKWTAWTAVSLLVVGLALQTAANVV